MNSRRAPLRLLTFLLLPLTATLFLGCGDDDESGSSSGTGGTGATSTGGAGTGADGTGGGATGAAGTGGGATGGGGAGVQSGVDCSPPEGALPTLGLSEVASGLSGPLLVKSPVGDDTRLFVIEQAGRVILLKDGNQTVFLDITAEVDDGGNEQGLLGIAFHPSYETNGRFFLHYSDNNGDTAVQEFHRSDADPDVADATAVGAPFVSESQFASNHNGGSIEFGPDGLLYIFLGDGGGGGDPQDNGQDANTPLAAALRIDVDNGYAAAGNYPGGDARVWLIGLRNPWRASFDACTGDLYIGDVGQDSFEEIDVVPAGMQNLNFGWNTMEGNSCYGGGNCDMTGLTLPVLEYAHNNNPCDSTVGGYVYRGGDIPALRGTYFYADTCRDQLWSFRWSGGTVSEQQERPALAVGSMVSFGQDNSGEVYIVSLGGSIFKIVPQ